MKSVSLFFERHFVFISGEFLGTKLLAVLAHGYGFYGGWCLPRYPGGSSLVCSVLLRVIQMIQEKRGGSLPPTLLIQADNCGRENKNQYAIAFCGWLVDQGFFQEVRLSFLLVGHTHSIIDQRFSIIHRKLKNRAILDMEEMFSSVADLFKDDGFVHHEVVHDIVDWQLFFQGTRHDLQGLGTMRTTINKGRSVHCLRIKKDSDNDVAFDFKEWDSCGVPWTGKWDVPEKPIKIFKSTNFPSKFPIHARNKIANLDKVRTNCTVRYFPSLKRNFCLEITGISTIILLCTFLH
jgi:hypothetical protein